MFRYRNVSLLLLLTMTLSLLVACGDQTTKTPTEITPADIAFYLGAPQIEYAGIYAAISQGYFRNKNST